MTTTKPQSTTETLLPCPFASLGGKHELETKEDANRWKPFQWIVTCWCGATGPQRSTEVDAIIAWNTRISPASTAPVVDQASVPAQGEMWHKGDEEMPGREEILVVHDRVFSIGYKNEFDLLNRNAFVAWCTTKDLAAAAKRFAAATAAPVEQSDEKIETHLGDLPFSLIGEIHERRQTIYRGIDYRVSPDVAAKLKTDLDYLMAFVVALRAAPSSTSARAAAEEIREWIGISGLVDGKGIDEVAAIIERHCFSGTAQ